MAESAPRKTEDEEGKEVQVESAAGERVGQWLNAAVRGGDVPNIGGR
jgi:hypothetical protein